MKLSRLVDACSSGKLEVPESSGLPASSASYLILALVGLAGLGSSLSVSYLSLSLSL